MKVKQLIKELSQYGDDMEVHFSYNYGDYWKTTVAPGVSNVSESEVKYSAYHQMDTIENERDEDDEPLTDDDGRVIESDNRVVVILS